MTNEQLLAESEIRNLIARLAHLADDGDLDDYIVCFTEDARWGGGGQPWREGRDDIREGADERRGSGIVGPGSAARHVVTTTYVEFDSEQQARSRSVFHFYISLDAEPKLVAMGVYADTFRLVEGRWLLAERELIGSAKDINKR